MIERANEKNDTPLPQKKNVYTNTYEHFDIAACVDEI